MSDWTFNWRSEDPVAIVLFTLFMIILLFFPWQDWDPTESLKVGPEPQAAAEATE